MAHACSKRDKNILRPFCGFFLAGRDRSKRIPRTTTRNTRTFTHSDTRVSERKRVSRRLTFYQWHNRNLVFLGDAASVRAQVAKLGWRSNAGVGKLARYRELQLPSSTQIGWTRNLFRGVRCGKQSTRFLENSPLDILHGLKAT